MKKLLIIATVAVATVAHAQESSPIKADIRAGVQFPASADLSGTFWGLGVDLTFDKSLLRGSETFLSVDWVTKSSRNNRNNMFPIMLNQRWQLQQAGMESPVSTYAFAGVGLAIVDFGVSSTVLAGRIGLGANFSPNVFGEAAFIITSRAKTTDIQGNHFGLYIGYRF